MSLSATERGSFHLKLEWQEPAEKNGIIVKYVIEYRIGEFPVISFC